MSRLPRAPSEAVIEVRGLCNRFGPQSVHENLDLDVYKGEILAVVGGSGTGKSVLLRSIVGLNRPSEGMVKVFGQNLPNLAEHERSLIERRFGVLFQKGALFSSLTVTENVALPLILTLRDALGLSVFLVTHDLDTLYTITDRVAVLAQKKVLVAGPIDDVSETADAWIHEYFHGPRGRSALDAAKQLNEV